MRRATLIATVRRGAVPTTVFVLIVTAFALFWRNSEHHETETMRMRTSVSADQVAIRLEDHLRVRLHLLEHIRDEWRAGRVQDEGAFREHAAEVQAYFDGIVAINWVDGDGVIRWVAPPTGNESAINRDLTLNAVAAPALESARLSGEARLTRPLDLYQGGRGFAAYIPLEQDGRNAGFVNAAFRIAPLVNGCLAQGVRENFYYAISDADVPLYAWTRDTDRAGIDFVQHRAVEVGDRVWRLSIWPTGALVAQHRAWSDEATLAFGIFMAFGLALTSLRVVRQQEERRDSDERFRTIFNAVEDGILVFARDGTILDANDRACALFRTERDALRDGDLAALQGIDAELLGQRVERASRESDASSAQWHLQRADGSAWCAEIEFVMIAIAGETSVVAVVRDVSERQQLEEQLRQAQKMEAMGTLAGGIAHDFNNILTAISGHAELAGMTISAHTAERRSIDGILSACRQATGLTRSLLTFSRRSTPHRSAVDLVQVVRDTLVLLRPLLPAAVLVSAEIDPKHPLWIQGDAAQLQQILLNLTLNARDAMPDGGALEVGAHRDAHDANTIVLQVSDTGTGMSERVKRRITEPFFTTKTRERGTGLGMSVVHGIVTDHHGTLEIESVLGEGTSIHVRLPAGAPPREAVITATPDSASGIAPLLSRVLLVEDNRHVSKLLASVFAANGYGVHIESDGLAALAAYKHQSHDLDLLVLDVDLPGMSGTNCLRAIRESGGHQPALLISGNPELAAHPEEFGNTRFLEKPFSMERLITVASELVGRPV